MHPRVVRVEPRCMEETLLRLLNLDALVEEGAISPEDLELITYVDTPDDAWTVIRKFYGL